MEQIKRIRFIDSRYNDLFSIKDGEHVRITKQSGEVLIRPCKYLDECHVQVGLNTYHICQFAESMERSGSIYSPAGEPEVVQGYTITDMMKIGDTTIVIGHNPKAPSPYVTWQAKSFREGYDLGHYFSDLGDAQYDYMRRYMREKQIDLPSPTNRPRSVLER